MAQPRSDSDVQLIDELSVKDLKGFINRTYGDGYAEKNPRKLIDTAWIDADALRHYLNVIKRNSETSDAPPPIKPEPVAASIPPPLSSAPREVINLVSESESETEPNTDCAPGAVGQSDVFSTIDREISRPNSSFSIYSETSPFMVLDTASLCSSSFQTGSEPFQSRPPSSASFVSDWDGRISEAQSRAPSSTSNYLDLPPLDAETDNSTSALQYTNFALPNTEATNNFRSPSPYDMSSNDEDPASLDGLDRSILHDSGTRWLEPHIQSERRVVTHRFTNDKRSEVQCIEYLDNEIPSSFPVKAGELSVGYVIRFEDEKWNTPLKAANDRIDNLIKDMSNESYGGGSGRGDDPVPVTFEPGAAPVVCYRNRSRCQGCHVCDRIDMNLIDFERFDLETASRDAVAAAERNTRRVDGGDPDGALAIFMNYLLRHPCEKGGTKCTGSFILKKKMHPSKGQTHFVGCSDWTPQDRQHINLNIPHNVRHAALANALANQKSTSVENSAPCSAVIPPHVGGRKKYCQYGHVAGNQPVQGNIVPHACYNRRTIYVPVDPTIRWAVLFHPESKPHTHPLFPARKATKVAKIRYSGAVNAAGVIGTTTSKVDNAASTPFLFDGLAPEEFAPGLLDNRVKRDIITAEKKKKYPAGMGMAGAYQLFLDDRDKPITDPTKYYHRWHNTDDGGVIVFTCFVALLCLLDDDGVKSFEDDTSFKRLAELHEWELVIFYKALESAVTIARVYTNRAGTEIYKWIFDTLRAIKVEATGKDLRFKRFVSGGNLLVMNVDMEAAQILGAARSIINTNKPQFSGITTVDPAVFATYFVKLCGVHALRGVNDFKGILGSEDFRRIQNFRHIQTIDKLNTFTQWIYSLKIERITTWWKHKIQSEWLLPCLIKSHSRIHPDDWDATVDNTNIGEGQHHRINKVTGIGLSAVDGMESARLNDLSVVRRLDISTSTGVLPNANNSEYHRLSRGIGRQAAAAQRARNAREQIETTADLKSLIAAEQALRKESIVTEKRLQAELKGTKGAKKRSKCAVASSSSSGRVKIAGLRAGLNDSAVLPIAEDNITPGALPVTSISGPVPPSGSSTDYFVDPVPLLAPGSYPQPVAAPDWSFYEASQSVFPSGSTNSLPMTSDDVLDQFLRLTDNSSYGLDNDSIHGTLGLSGASFNSDPIFGSGIDAYLHPDSHFNTAVSTHSEFTTAAFAHSAYPTETNLPRLPPPPEFFSPPALDHDLSASIPAPLAQTRGRQEVDACNIVSGVRTRVKRTRSADNDIGTSRRAKSQK